MKKKVGKILLIVWAALATILLVLSCAAYNQADTEWLAKYNELKEQHDSLSESYLDLKNQDIVGSADVIVFDAWAKRISEEHFVCKIDDETVLAVVCAEGRTESKLLSDVSEYSFAFTTALKSGGYEKGIIILLNDDNNVWAGFTVSADGETNSFIGESWNG